MPKNLKRTDFIYNTSYSNYSRVYKGPKGGLYLKLGKELSSVRKGAIQMKRHPGSIEKFKKKRKKRKR